MKYEQLDALKKLLELRAKDLPSKQLDEEIARAARSLPEHENACRPILKWLFAPASFAGNALASVMLTAVAFLGMAKIIAIPEPEVVFVDAVEPITAIAAANSISRQNPALVSRPYFEVYAPDQVLLEISLPSVPDLIRSMEFVAESERSAATIELIAALADINLLIDGGELNHARSRYAELRQRCYACQLPNTLEALALAKLDSPGHG